MKKFNLFLIGTLFFTTTMAQNVGIGTTTPQYNLQIAGTVNSLTSFTSTATGHLSSDGLLIGIETGSTDALLIHKENAALRLGTNNLERLRILGNGNIGIGTAAPNAALQFGNILANRRLVLWEDANNDHQFHGFGVGIATLRYQVTNSSASHVFYAGTSATSSAELMRIQGNGNVGIGTATPNAALQLGNVFANRRLVLYEDGNNDHQFAGLGINGNVFRYQISDPAVSHIFYAGTSASTSRELMRISGSGLVELNGAYGIYQMHPIYPPFNSTVLMATLNGLTNGPQMRFESSLAGYVDIGLNSSGNFVVEGNDDPKLIVTVAGNVGIGTVPTTAKLDVNGTIRITDGTQAANRILTSDGSGFASWQNLPSRNYGFKATQTLTQFIPASAGGTQVLWPTEVYDDANAFNANAYTAPVSGLYHFDIKINWDISSGVTGVPFTILSLRKNGSTVATTYENISAGSTTAVTVNLSADLKLTANDVMIVTVNQPPSGSPGLMPGEPLFFLVVTGCTNGASIETYYGLDQV